MGGCQIFIFDISPCDAVKRKGVPKSLDRTPATAWAEASFVTAGASAASTRTVGRPEPYLNSDRMNIYIALFRGINVGGKNSLPMKELVALLEDLGAKKVRTYIQSGNAVFHSAEKNASQLSKQLSAEIKKRHSFAPHVLILGLEAINTAIAKNPFPEAEADPSSLHLGFLASTPKNPDLEKLNSLKKASERFHLSDNVFYLHAPEGVGRSKLAASTEKLLGVPMTDRNWRTVCKIKELAGE